MAAFFKALIGAIGAFPKMIDLVEKIWSSLGDALFEFKRKRAEKDLADGIEKARKDKNTCELEKAFNPDKNCD